MGQELPVGVAWSSSDDNATYRVLVLLALWTFAPAG